VKLSLKCFDRKKNWCINGNVKCKRIWYDSIYGFIEIESAFCGFCWPFSKIFRLLYRFGDSIDRFVFCFKQVNAFWWPWRFFYLFDEKKRKIIINYIYIASFWLLCNVLFELNKTKQSFTTVPIASINTSNNNKQKQHAHIT
jgi:hypothetical protein